MALAYKHLLITLATHQMKNNQVHETVKDLYTFKNMQIDALQKELCKANTRITNLETFIFELCDDGCPESYKDIVKKEVLNDFTRD